MTAAKTPSEIARETLIRLAKSHVPPTPVNYQACYNEIAELPNTAVFPEQPLRHIARELSGHNPEQVRHLRSLDEAIGRRSWQGFEKALVAYIAVGHDHGHGGGSALSPALAAHLAHFVEGVQPVFSDESAPVAGLFADLLAVLRTMPVNEEKLHNLLAEGQDKVRAAVGRQLEVKHSLLKLLHLIIENIGELSLDDHWLKGQIDGLLTVITLPLNLRHLGEMEQRLRDVMARQGGAKDQAVKARQEMRRMLEAFVEHLAMINASSASFQGKVEQSAREIAAVSRFEDLTPLLADLVEATRIMVDETASSRQRLQYLQERVQASEAELVQLHLELDNASAMARHDPLTDALNRKGLDEALTREIADMRRKDTPLSVCLLDIDNFKKINDRLGHDVGDVALVHLARIVRANLRPSDALARYGGEEFVILMPDTDLDGGLKTISRLQHELTKAIFLAGKEKILITFSAGVAQLKADESGAEAIRRADRAMYLAKHAGKNRVMSG
ncbi:MAG: GGDEF domain-containing protein [Azonexus sp.]|jgi:diguanylate cyclase|nr:GGDEF domain-containing protein [Azonexus sp.]